MLINLFHNLTEKDKSQAVKKLINHSMPRQDFFLLMVLSILMATFGFLINNVAVIIGSMLITPMLYPMLSLSLGIVMADSKLISRSFYTISKSMAFGIAAATIATLFFPSKGFDIATSELIYKVEPSFIYLAIAIVAGIAASFALVKPNLMEILPGVAISVALIPPLALIGIGIAKLNWEVISNSVALFLVNLFGIVFVSMVIFSLMNFYVKKQIAARAIKKEEKEIEEENKRIRRK
jgi:uncharacterized hydrophobic protein (TIGR00271 family)